MVCTVLLRVATPFAGSGTHGGPRRRCFLRQRLARFTKAHGLGIRISDSNLGNSGQRMQRRFSTLSPE